MFQKNKYQVRIMFRTGFPLILLPANVCQIQIVLYSYHCNHDCSSEEFLVGILINFVRLIACSLIN